MLKIVFGILFIMLIICAALSLCSGCSTTKVGVTELAVAGGKEIGRLEQLDKELDRISQSARGELSRAGASTKELGDIISRVFNIAYELCDQIDSLRAEIRASQESGNNLGSDTGRPIPNQNSD